jgi:hypothetical protein
VLERLLVVAHSVLLFDARLCSSDKVIL